MKNLISIFKKVGATDRMMKVGDSHKITKVFTKDDISTFADLVGDVNPVHFFPCTTDEVQDECLVHGVMVTGLISSIIGNDLPGVGTILLEENLKFVGATWTGEEITCEATVKEFKDNKIILNTEVYGSESKAKKIVGETIVMNPFIEEEI